jgi:hypothetical protein
MANEMIREGTASAPGQERGSLSEQQEKDRNHLSTLSLIYYILAALNTLSTLMGFLALLGIGIFFVAFAGAGPADDPALPTRLGFILIGVSALVLLLGGVGAYLTYLTGRSLKQRRRRTLCFVVACLMLPSFPLGTLLGIFTIIVLLRPSVQELFARSAAA